MHTKKTIFLLVATICVVAVVLLMLNKRSNEITTIESDSTTPATSTNTQPAALSETETKTKTYRNEEWGFEFRYPKEWVLEENSFGSPFSKFNLQGDVSAKDYNPFNSALLVNIVTPDFVKMGFSNLEKIAQEVRVGEVIGKKYEYTDQFQEITIILPHGEYRMIFGTTKEYETIFNQILASLKFLRNNQ